MVRLDMEWPVGCTSYAQYCARRHIPPPTTPSPPAIRFCDKWVSKDAEEAIAELTSSTDLRRRVHAMQHNHYDRLGNHAEHRCDFKYDFRIRLVISIENGPTRLNNVLTSHSLVNLDQPVLLAVPSISSYLTSSALWWIEKCDLDQILDPKSTSPTDATSGEHDCTTHDWTCLFLGCKIFSVSTRAPFA